jgi:hypothetical protein
MVWIIAVVLTFGCCAMIVVYLYVLKWGLRGGTLEPQAWKAIRASSPLWPTFTSTLSGNHSTLPLSVCGRVATAFGFYYAILPTATEMPAYQLAHRISDYQYEVAGSRRCSLHDAFSSKCMSGLAS